MESGKKPLGVTYSFDSGISPRKSDHLIVELGGQKTLETQLRSLIKTISWRVIATMLTVVISYAVLTDWKSSLVIGLGANGLKMVVYYIHERAWNLAQWGRKPWVSSKANAPSNELPSELSQQPN